MCICVMIAACVAIWLKAEAGHIAALACPVTVDQLDDINSTALLDLSESENADGGAADAGLDCLDIPNMTSVLSLVGSVINLACILFFSIFYQQVGKFLTDAEIHRTDTVHTEHPL